MSNNNLTEYYYNKALSLTESAFKYCDKLKAVKGNKNLKRIAAQAFADCLELKYIELPLDLTLLHPFSFDGSEKLEEIFWY